MISKYFKEQYRYTQTDLIKSFECNEKKGIVIIRKLKEYNVLKVVKAVPAQKYLSDLDVIDEEISEVYADDNDNYYVFTFVGVIVVDGIILKIYPKYLSDTNNIKEELKIAIKVIEKYNKKADVVKMVNGFQENASFNYLAVMLYFINDYYENGVYSNSKDIMECNGMGEILWDRTINETFTLLSNNRPYYVELQTKKKINNQFDFFQKLHECILSECSSELESSDLMDLFDITPVALTENTIEDFGDIEYILYQIQSEINIQFNTRKQLLLKAMYAYIAQEKQLEFSNCFSMFGTNSFNLVWEEVCASIMNNQLKKPLGELCLPTSIQLQYDKKALLIEQIEKPEWIGYDKYGKEFCKVAKETLIPDLISIFNDGEESIFFIFDAKYYNLCLEDNKELSGQPGIESVTKQYLYNLAYRSFAFEHGIKKIRNAFLLPSENKDIEFKGYVRLAMLQNIGLEAIEVWLLPTKKIYQYYLTGKKVHINELKIL